MWKEFKEFAIKGNMIDLAVGVIIGGAFSKLVSSVVNDLFMPLVSLITGKIDFSNLSIPVMNPLDGTVYTSIQYGSFLTQLIDFLIMAFVVFLFVKGMNRLRKADKTEEAPATSKVCPFCKTEISIDATRCPHCTSELGDSEAE